MAIVLGNFNKSREIAMLNESIQYDAKMGRVLALIDMVKPQADRAKDIYDTYRYIVQVDKAFANELWNLLTRFGNVDINSYFSWRVGYGSIYLSRYGVSFIDCTRMEEVSNYYGLTCRDEFYSGKVLLTDYLKHFKITENQLDSYAKELENLIKHFDEYAQSFFDSVSAYKIVEV